MVKFSIPSAGAAAPGGWDAKRTSVFVTTIWMLALLLIVLLNNSSFTPVVWIAAAAVSFYVRYRQSV